MTGRRGLAAAAAATLAALLARWAGGELLACLGAAVLGGAAPLHAVHPRAAAALLLAGTALGLADPSAGGFAPLVLGFNAYGVGRCSGGPLRLASAAVLVCGAVARVHAEDFVPCLFLVFAPLLAGWTLGDRDLVARQLTERGLELEAERDVYAELSVRYERARIAAELHDIVAHAIAVMVVQAGAGQRLARADPEGTQEAFAAIADAARHAEADMAQLTALLTDPGDHTPDAELALVRELVARAAATGLDVTLRLTGDRGLLAPDTARSTYLVVREGLTNALRHAAGAPVRVGVHGRRDALVVDVVNGPAPPSPPRADTGSGLGLQGLRERLDAAGARLDAGPTGDGGWALRVALPRRAPAGSSPRMSGVHPGG